MAVDAAAMTEATAPNAEAPTEAQAAVPEIDIWAELSKVDLDELIRRDPRLQGKIGSLAQQQTQRQMYDYQTQAAQRQRQLDEAADRARMRDLAQRDPDGLAQKVQQDLIMKEYQEQQTLILNTQQNEMRQALAQRLDRVMAKPRFQEVWNNSSAEVRQKLSWTSYQEIDDFFDASNEIISEYFSEKKASEKAEKLADKRLEALRKEGAIEGVQADATASGGADLNLDGLSTGDHIYTQDEIRTHMADPAWRKANMSKVNAQYRQGLIKSS